MLFEPGEQIERLEAVDTELFKEIIVRTEFCPRYFEVRCRKIKNLLGSVLKWLPSSLRYDKPFFMPDYGK